MSLSDVPESTGGDTSSPPRRHGSLLEEAVDAFDREVERMLRLDMIGPGLDIALGVIAGLYRCRGCDDGDLLLSWAPDFPLEQAGSVVDDLETAGIEPPDEMIVDLVPEWADRLTSRKRASAWSTRLAVDPARDHSRSEATITALMDKYAQYVRDEHAICWGCPVVRSGALVVRSMLDWKATRRDGRLGHWTRRDIRDYLLDFLPGTGVDYGWLGDAPTCAKDLVYFLSDHGTLTGDDVGVLADATDDVFYGIAKPIELIAERPSAKPTPSRRAKRRAARVARKRNRRG